MEIHQPSNLAVFIPEVRREHTSLGFGTVVFVVRVIDFGEEHIVDLDDSDFSYLHEKLTEQCRSVPQFPSRGLSLFDNESKTHLRRIDYERYLNEVLSSPACVSSPTLWAILRVDPPAASVQRFLVRGDNINQLESLSSLSSEAFRVCTVAVIKAVGRVMLERSDDLATISSGSSVLLRAATRRDARLITESGLISACMRLLFLLPRQCLQTFSPTFEAVVESHPSTLFVYFERDGGWSTLIDSLSGPPMEPAALVSLAYIVWLGVTGSSDLEIAISEKSSMTVLNKLLVLGQGTETELVVACVLGYLFVRGRVPEFGSKIFAVVETAISEMRLDYRFDMLKEPKRVFQFIGKLNLAEPVEPRLVELGCFVLIAKCTQRIQNNDPDWADRTGLKPQISERLSRIIDDERLPASTRGYAAEALLMLGAGGEGDVVELQNRRVTEKIQNLNNFSIQANFDLSSRGGAAGVFTPASELALSQLVEGMHVLTRSVGSVQESMQTVLSVALNEVVSGMFQVKSLLKQAEGATASTETLRLVNADTIKLNSEKLVFLRESVSEIDSKSSTISGDMYKLKSVLLKIKHSVDEVLDEIDAETGSSPVSP